MAKINSHNAFAKNLDELIKDHVKNIPNVSKLVDLNNGGVRFIYEEYAVEIYKNGKLFVNYNNSFDHLGNPLPGCWEINSFETAEDVIDFLSTVEEWE